MILGRLNKPIYILNCLRTALMTVKELGVAGRMQDIPGFAIFVHNTSVKVVLTYQIW